MTKGADQAADPRASFTDVVGRAASEDPQAVVGEGAAAVEDRRVQLLAYRKRVEAARLEHQVRLERLAEAQAKIEAELERMERHEEARRAREEALNSETRTIEEERARLDADRARRANERQRIEEETRRIEQENRELEERRAAQAAEAARLAEDDERARQQREELQRRQAEQDREAAREAKAHLETIELRRQQVGQIQEKLKEQAAPVAAKPAGGAPRVTPAAKGNTRRSPRFEIHAAVRFKIPGDVIVMRARNISMTGALLATEQATLAKFPVGTEHTAMVFLSESASESVAVQAQVVRHEDKALVIDWSADVESSFRVALLIATLPGD